MGLEMHWGVCNTTDHLPTSTLLATEKRGCSATVSGGLADMRREEYHGSSVTIRAFRMYSAQNEVKGVSIRPDIGVYH